MKFAIADPPYLGRANRWYGTGQGSGRVITSGGRPARKPDFHPEAAKWDKIESHIGLVEQMTRGYDGWVLAGTPESAALIYPHCPAGTRIGSWVKTNAMPAGARVINSWESVLWFTPKDRRARGGPGTFSRDTLVASVKPIGFLGSKPPEWTDWVLNLLGFRRGDSVDDLFRGSGAVADRITGQS